MDRHKTIEILEALASGYSPLTGARLANDSVLNEREVIRALQIAIDYLNTNQLPNLASIKINGNEIQSVIELFRQEEVNVTTDRLVDFFLARRMFKNQALVSNAYYGKYRDHYSKGLLWDFFNRYLADNNFALEAKGLKMKKKKDNRYKEIDFFQQETFNKLSEKAIQQLKDKVSELELQRTENLSEHIQEARLKCPRAFEPWSEKEKELLKKAIEYTNDLDLLANCFQRGKNSIEIYGQKIIYDAQNPQDDSE